LDKIISAAAPQWGLRRAAARKGLRSIQNSGYGSYGANTHKKSAKGWGYHSGSVHEDIHDHLQTLREKSRDLYMGVPLATGALKTHRTCIIGSGLSLKAQVDREFLGLSDTEAAALEESIEREWELWADSTDCDLMRMDNFYELQQLVFLNWLMSGDVIATLPVTKRAGSIYDLRVCLIEADRLCNPTGINSFGDDRIVSGVEVDGRGEVVAYHIAAHHPGSTHGQGYKWTRVKAFGDATGRRNVLHVMNRERIGQRRGVPILAPVIETLKQLGRYTEAEIDAAVVSGMLSVFIEKESSNGEAPVGSVLPENQQVDAGDPNSIELGPGTVWDLNEGEKANAVTPGRPNANFDGFVTALTRQIGAALEVPYELLMKQFTASYSASRGALLEAWKTFRMYRDWMASDFCQPIYEEWLAEAVGRGRIKAPGFFSDPMIRRAYCGAEWYGPSQGQLNPVQEVQAATLRMETGLSSGSREAMEMTDTDYFKNVAQRRREVRAMQEVQKQDASSNTK